jgi:pimeloyl-ACP methyl ester carboxylesterase
VHRPAAESRVRTAAGRWWPLAVLAVLTISLAQGGAVPTWSGLVHAVALPPLDLALDLRLIVAQAPGYPQLAVAVAASLVLRTLALGALFVTLGVTPSPRAAFGYAARLYAAAAVPLALAGALEFAGLASLYAWYAWLGLGLTVLMTLILTSRRLARPGTRLRRFPLLVGYLAALAALGALGRVEPWGTAVAVVASAVLTGVVLTRLVAPPPAHWRRAAAPAAAASTGFLLAAALVVLPAAAQVPVAPDASLLVVPGVDTASGRGAAYRLDPEALGFPCDRVFYFSYRGPEGQAPQDQAACPLRLHRPYSPQATQQPLGQLVDAFDRQLVAIRRETGDAPVLVVTHSQGAVVAWRAAARGRAGDVPLLIALAGFPHSPMGYPPPRVAGAGRVGADGLRALSWLSRVVGFGTFDPDAPLAREILARSNGLEDVFDEPLPPETAGVLLFATADTIAAPEGHAMPGAATLTIGSTHVGILESPATEEAVRAIMSGGRPSEDRLLAPILAAILPAFMPPPAEG